MSVIVGNMRKKGARKFISPGRKPFFENFGSINLLGPEKLVS